ncbi:TPA: hypothetical protein ACH3X1_010652 [Trebouxia sp. C0004]
MLGHRVLFTPASQVPSVRSLYQVGSGRGSIACVQAQTCCLCLGNCVAMVTHGHMSVEMIVELCFTELTSCNARLDCIYYKYAGIGMHGASGVCGANNLLELHASCNH